MVKFKFAIELHYEVFDAVSDFIINIHAAQTPCQRVVCEQWSVNQPVETEVYADPGTGARYMRLQAKNGALHIRYDASVEIAHHQATPDT